MLAASPFPAFRRSQFVAAFCSAVLVYLLIQRAGAETPPRTPPAELKSKAEAGDATAMYWLASRYETGWGIPQDVKEALRWYTAAAEKKDASAMKSIGRIYHEGRPGV